MTCSFFTIIKSYFRCCCDVHKKTENNDDGSGDRYHPDCGDSSPFTFDDLSSSTNDSGTSSAWSSSSTLDGFDEKHKTALKESAHRIKKYQRKLFHPYEEDTR